MPPNGPLPSITADLLAIRQAAEARSGKARNTARSQMTVLRAYHQLFHGDDGALREAAQIVLDDIAAEAGFGIINGSIDHADLALAEGKRRMLLHIIARLNVSPERVHELESQMSQEEDNAG
jgi:hypothetical protein